MEYRPMQVSLAAANLDHLRTVVKKARSNTDKVKDLVGVSIQKEGSGCAHYLHLSFQHLMLQTKTLVGICMPDSKYMVLMEEVPLKDAPYIC